MSASKGKFVPPLSVQRRRESRTVAVISDGKLVADALGELASVEEQCSSSDANLEKLLAHFERVADAVLRGCAVRVHEQNRSLAEDVAEIVPRTRRLAERLPISDRADLFDALWAALCVVDIEHDMDFSHQVHAGAGTQRGGIKGAEATHGRREARDATRGLWRQRFATLRDKFPEDLKQDLLSIIAAEANVSVRTVRRYIKQR